MGVPVLGIGMAQFSKCFPVFKPQKKLCQPLHICLLFVSLPSYSAFLMHTIATIFFGGGAVSVDDSLFKKYCFFLFDLASCLQLPSETLTHWMWLESRSCLFQFSLHVLSFVRAVLYLIYLPPGWWLHIQSVCQVLLRQPFQTR